MPVLINPFILIPTVSLVAQIIVLGLLIYGYWLKRRSNFLHHGKIMSIALILHLIVIFAIMVPSFALAIIPEYLLRNSFGSVSIISLIHVPFGALAFLFGLWFIIGWHLSGLNGCFKLKKFMLPTLIMWLSSLVLGIVLYGVLIMPLLMR